MGETRQAVATITGGSQGIGAGLVAGYRRRGWAVVATAHRRRADRRPLTTPAPQGGGSTASADTAGRGGPPYPPHCRPAAPLAPHPGGTPPACPPAPRPPV